MKGSTNIFAYFISELLVEFSKSYDIPDKYFDGLQNIKLSVEREFRMILFESV